MSIWLTPEVRQNQYPANGEHFLTYIDRSRAAGDSVGTEFGGYCTAGDFTVTGWNTGYDPPVTYNLWDTYRECTKDESCTGMTPAS